MARLCWSARHTAMQVTRAVIPGGYRSPEEVQHWRERDPIPHMRTLLIKERGLAEAEVNSIEHACQSEVEEAVEFARNSPEPAMEETYRHVFAEGQ